MKTILSAVVVATMLPSCSVLFDAADITNRQSKALAQGEAVIGDGFTVRAPESGLYPSSKDRQPGGVILRPTEPAFDGLVYLATPFNGGGASTPREAFERWNEMPKARGFTVTTLSGGSTDFRGLPAYKASVELSKGSASHVASMLIVKRSSDFLVLSTGHPFIHPATRAERREYTDTRLRKLQAATTISKR